MKIEDAKFYKISSKKVWKLSNKLSFFEFISNSDRILGMIGEYQKTKTAKIKIEAIHKFIRYLARKVGNYLTT